jgi:RimJ/RimL family protein N-acetyltransferase
MSNALVFRPLQRSDLPLLHRWLWEPHVVRWWGEPLSFDEIEAKYQPRIDGTEPTHVFIMEYGLRPIGLIQWYKWSDYPAHAAKLEAEPQSAGIDLTIGEGDLLARGIGSAAIRQFVREVVFADPAITAVFADPEEANPRSVGAFMKAGFHVVRTTTSPGENVPRSVVRFVRSPAA